MSDFVVTNPFGNGIPDPYFGIPSNVDPETPGDFGQTASDGNRIYYKFPTDGGWAELAKSSDIVGFEDAVDDLTTEVSDLSTDVSVLTDELSFVSSSLSSHIGAGGSAHAYVDSLQSGFMTSAEHIKLSNISPGATANLDNASLLARSNHTGTQDQSTVVNLVSDLALKAPLANAQHTTTTGQVTTFTGSTANNTYPVVKISNTLHGGSAAMIMEGDIGWFSGYQPQPFAENSTATTSTTVLRMVETRSRTAIQLEEEPEDPTAYWDSFWVYPSRNMLPEDYYFWGEWYTNGDIVNGKLAYYKNGTPVHEFFGGVSMTWSSVNSAWELLYENPLGTLGFPDHRLWRRVGGGPNVDSPGGNWTWISGGTAPAPANFTNPRLYFNKLNNGQVLFLVDQPDVIGIKDVASIAKVPRLNFDGEWPVAGLKPREIPYGDLSTDVPAAGELFTVPYFNYCTGMGDGVTVAGELPWRGHQIYTLSSHPDYVDYLNLIDGIVTLPLNADKVTINQSYSPVSAGGTGVIEFDTYNYNTEVVFNASGPGYYGQVNHYMREIFPHNVVYTGFYTESTVNDPRSVVFKINDSVALGSASALLLACNGATLMYASS
jgi:hypothetical protein